MPPSLTLDDIADGAIRLIEELGPSRVTARNLGAELHVAAATLYTVVRSLDEVDHAARSKLNAEWKPELDEVNRTGSAQAFVDSIGSSRRNAALFMTDPTRVGSGSLDFAQQLFPGVSDMTMLADLQAIVHASIRTGPSTGTDLEAAFFAHGAAMESRGQAQLPAPAGPPMMPDVLDEVIESRLDGERRQLLTRVGIELVEQGGVDEWVFRRVVDASGVPLTTVHRAGDRHTHLTGLAAVLSEAAWLRAGQESDAGADASTSIRLGVAAREMQGGANPGLLAELQRPRTEVDPPAPLVAADMVDDPAVGAALPALTAIYVSRYVHAACEPTAWEEAPGLIADMVEAWPRS